MNTTVSQPPNTTFASPLQQLLHTYRSSSLTEREKGTYFEELTLSYLRHPATTDGISLATGMHEFIHPFSIGPA